MSSGNIVSQCLKTASTYSYLTFDHMRNRPAELPCNYGKVSIAMKLCLTLIFFTAEQSILLSTKDIDGKVCLPCLANKDKPF